MELNAENIINEIQWLIKALKDCGGWVKRGNGEGWFNHEILADALTLINSQEQRIKELTEENERLKLADSIASVSVPEALRIINEYCESYIKKAKADTVWKMQERLKIAMRDVSKYSFNGRDYSVIGEEFIDQIVKEMLEEK